MKIAESALERFGLPAEAAGAGRLTLTGNSHLSVENHRGLLEYSGEFIVVALKKGRLAIKGQGLCLEAMEKESLVIKGRIDGIEVG